MNTGDAIERLPNGINRFGLGHHRGARRCMQIGGQAGASTGTLTPSGPSVADDGTGRDRESPAGE